MAEQAHIKVAIVGGRATGAAVAVHVASHVPAGSAIIIIDPERRDYPSVFDDPDQALLANTSAEIMSLYPDRPDDVLNFLGQRSRYRFPPRMAIGAYCRDRLERAADAASVRGVTLRRIRATVLAITGVDGGCLLRLDGHTRTLSATHAVIAVGAQHTGLAHFGVLPYPAQRLRLAAAPRVLVRGQGLSGVEAALILAETGSAVTMTSRTGLLPAVRTHTFAIPLACKVVPPVDFRRAIHEHLRNSGLPPLHRQLADHPDPVQRLGQELWLADQGQSWQDPIVGLVDAVVRHAWPVIEDHEFLWRYITAMTADTARQLATRLSQGDISLAPPGTVDPNRFDLVVNATGITAPPIAAEGRTVYLAAMPSGARRVSISADLRVTPPDRTQPERIWVVGPSSGPRVRFANFLRAAVIQAQSVATQIAEVHRE